nr:MULTISPECIES: glycosyltransferase family protein [unclassified Cryobacterium]
MAILQARASSTRLPGKVLAPVLGEPMIGRQLERIGRANAIDEVVVATSIDESDDDLAEVLVKGGAIVRRGPLEDVLARFNQVLDEFRPSHIVRLTADCPLTDPDVIDRVIEAHLESGADYTSNVLTRTFPHGLDVEVFKAEAMRQLQSLRLSDEEREHVTLGIYSRPDEFSLHSVTQRTDQSHLRWTVDYPADLEFARSVYERLYPRIPAFTTSDVIDLLASQPELAEINARL